MDVVVGPLTIAVSVGCGLVAGVFFAFSVAVMPALRRLPAASGTAVMQAVNTVIVGPLFLVLFVGTAIGCVALVLLAPTDLLRVLGAALYAVGAFGVTVAANIPLNNALDARGERVWARYLARWTAWNHVRTVAAAAAAVALTMA